VGENSYEYIIKRKTEGKVLLKKIGVGLLYLAFALVLLILINYLSPKELYIPLILISLALTALLIFATWRFTCVEYEVVLGGGDLMITVIYGKGFTKKLLNVPINSILELGEYDDAAYEAVSKLSLQKNYICMSSLSAPDIYYAVFDEDKDRCILYFDAPERAVEILKRQNSAAFRRGQMNK